MLLTGMFQGCAKAELDLSLEPGFRRALLASLRTCLTAHRAAYHRELLAYVRPWAATLEQVRCDVQIHHGDADTWAPLAMSKALENRLTGHVDLIVSRNLGHFSTLHACVQDVLNTATAG
jgi:pimeloyl-ACP methyl ester carboxylesterase